MKHIEKLVQEFLENSQDQVKLHGNKQHISILGKIAEKFSKQTFNSGQSPWGGEVDIGYKEN